MTAIVQENQEQTNKPSDKELNFRALEAKYQRELEKERQARLEAEKAAEEAKKAHNLHSEEDDSEEPYVAPKKLNKRLEKFGQSTQSEIQKAMQMAKDAAKEELKAELYVENNPDFYDVLNRADELIKRAPKLAENILKMPDNFERQKLVYQTMKELGVLKPQVKEPSIQEKVDANRRSPYYQPSNIGTAPYAQAGDFSPSGQKNAYNKMQELKARLRI